MTGQPRQGKRKKEALENFAFAIPVAPFVDDAQWRQLNIMLGGTLRSVLNQRNVNFHAFIAGHERPSILDDFTDSRVEFVPVEFEKPASPEARRRDKRNKRWAIAARFRELGGGYFMYLDADDYVHQDLTAYVHDDNNRVGYYLPRGFALDYKNRILAPIPGAFRHSFNHVCGSSGIIFFNQDDLPKRPYPKQLLRLDYFFKIRNHLSFDKQMRANAGNTPIPFAAAIYNLNNDLNLSNELVRTGDRQLSLVKGIKKHRIADAGKIAAEFGIVDFDPAPQEQAMADAVFPETAPGPESHAVKPAEQVLPSQEARKAPAPAAANPDLAPSMTEGEIGCLTKYMRRSSVYFEYGCGGTTGLASRSGVKHLVSVDSSQEWVEHVRSHPAISERVAAGDYRINWVDIGPIKDWGKPASRESAFLWPAYATAVWKLAPKSLVPDFVLVDGRFRVSCVLQSLIRCSSKTLIGLHDFQRQSYSTVLDFTDVVERVDHLVILRRKKSIDALEFARACSKHILDAK